VLSADDFLIRFPEFAEADPQLIVACLLDATERTSSVVMKDLTDQAIGLLAAHLLSISPWGRKNRKEGAPQKTTYEEELYWIQRMRGHGWGSL